MKIIKEIRHGLLSEFVLQCKMCNCLKHITNEDKSEYMNVNSAIVLGSISTGIGYSQINEVAASLNIPLMSMKTFNSYHESTAKIIKSSLWKSLGDAAAEEAKLATEDGDKDESGIPCITVVTDGAWGKRSYNVNYDSMSGVVSILLIYLNILFMVKIKLSSKYFIIYIF